MKKVSKVSNSKSLYTILESKNNIAYVSFASGKKALVNTKTHEIITKIDDYINCKAYGRFCLLEKKIDNTRKTVTIYDTLNEKMIADGWEFVKTLDRGDEIKVLKSTLDGKLHIFFESIYDDVFDMPFDSVEEIENDGHFIYYVLTTNGKKLIFQSSYGFNSKLWPKEYDNIEKVGTIIVFTENGKKSFTFSIEYSVIDGDFDSITVDSNNDSIVYCKKDGRIKIYTSKKERLLLDTTYYDDVKYISVKEYSVPCGYYSKRYGNYCFKTVKDGKVGILNIDCGFSDEHLFTIEVLTPCLKEIRELGDDKWLLIEDDKNKGLLSYFEDYGYDLCPILECDDIVLFGGDYCGLIKNGRCDIVKMTNQGCASYLVPHCEMASSQYKDGNIVYKQDGKYGIVMQGIVSPAKYDNIINVSENYFVVEENNKQGLMRKNKMILPVKYDEIKLLQPEEQKDPDDLKTLLFILKNENHYELVKITLANGAVRTYDYEFETAEYFSDIIVLTDELATYIYDYNGTKLRVFPLKPEITEIETQDCNYEKRYLYYIDGEYYLNDGKNFEPTNAVKDGINLYMTAYESEYGTVVVNSLDEAEHDRICAQIEGLDDQTFDDTLLGLYEQNPNVQKEYPVLKRK